MKSNREGGNVQAAVGTSEQAQPVWLVEGLAVEALGKSGPRNALPQHCSGWGDGEGGAESAMVG